MFSNDELIDIRRKLHQIPEIGLEEFRTHAYLQELIQNFPQEQLEIRTFETGILVKVKGNGERKKIIGWRCDIDGLPISEDTGLAFRSTIENQMHACGHDFHMSIALGLLDRIIHSDNKNDFLFIFQPAEENESGAMRLYNAGIFEGWEPDALYALHVAPELQVGDISTKTGLLFANAGTIEVNITGEGGHAAFPHLASDAIVIASEFIQGVQRIISRKVDPASEALITFGQISGGQANNIIADQVTLLGTIRNTQEDTKDRMETEIYKLARGLETMWDCHIDIHISYDGYVVVDNNEKLTKEFMDYMTDNDDCNFMPAKLALTGEDFGFLSSKFPGMMFWLGVDSQAGLHHNQFNPNERAIPFAVDILEKFFHHIDQ